MTLKHTIKYKELQAHRQMVYEAALDRILAGKETPEFVHYRWQKLKRVK